MKIIYTAGAYEVAQLVKLACKPCITAWNAGTLAKPKDGGDVCTHGRGEWQAGRTGPRGGWQGISPRYTSERAARIVCDALAEAAWIPAQGA